MNYPPVQYDIVQLQGGLDQVTPTLMLSPGFLRKSANFEASINGGYSRIAGYERYDGHARPSDATYTILTITLTGAIALNDTVVGATSGASGKVILVGNGFVVITRQVSNFFIGETVSVLAVPKGSVASILGASSDGLLDVTYLGLAAADYRASISTIPGSGSVLGLCWYNGKLYGFRNNAAGTAADLYASGATGWTKINFGEEISFTNANTSVNEGDVLTQGATTATVSRLVVETGTLLSGVNTGRMVLTARSGNFAAGAATSTAGGALTLSGASTAIALLPNGRFRCVVGNFGAGANNKAMYGADGKNRAFEFDGVNLVPIQTGMAVDTPNLIAVHKQHLFLTFGYSLQFSSTGSPFVWTPLTGAGEIAMPDDITNLVVLPGDQTSGALGVFSRRETSILYGTGASTFSLTTFNSGSGAVYDTAQNLDQTYVLNDFGVVSMATTRDFGNFSPSTLTMQIKPYISERIGRTIGSALSRSKGQYRIFFSDGSALYSTISNGKYLGSMPVEYYNAVSCLCEGDTTNGVATSYFGSTNGMVYEMDAGTSFDGVEISASIAMVFNKTGNHRVLKRYRKASLEISGGSYIAFEFGYQMGYGSLEYEQGYGQGYSQYLRASYWDSFIWDAFIWDGSEVAPAELSITGTAENISVQISSLSALIRPFTINTITLHYTPRRGLR